MTKIPTLLALTAAMMTMLTGRAFSMPAPAPGAERTTSSPVTALATPAASSTSISIDLVRPRGYLEDEGILDDIERLLDIIAEHVERMRQAGGITTNNDIGYGGNNDNGDRVSYNTTIYNSNTTSVNHTECIGQGVCNPVHVDSHDSGGKIDDKDKDKANGEEEGKTCEEKRKKNLRIKEMVPGRVPDAQEIVRIANQAGLGGLERHG